MPNRRSGLIPIKSLTKTKSDHWYLLWSYVWGCTVYALDLKLRNYHKIPMWNHRDLQEKFLGFSNERSSRVENLRKLCTGYISPQHHVIGDDIFQTVFSSGKTDFVVDSISN